MGQYKIEALAADIGIVDCFVDIDIVFVALLSLSAVHSTSA
jgi:hypothetical protein